MAFNPDDPAYVRAEIQKRSRDSEQRRVVMAALELGAPAKLTRSGVVFSGPDGTAGTHWTTSDHRALTNFETQLRRIGIPIPRPTPKRNGPRKFKPATPPKPGHHHRIPVPYEAPRKETTRYTVVIPTEPEPELEPTPQPRRDVGARARALGTRKERPEYASAYPRMSDDLRAFENHDLVVHALKQAEGDPRRITVEEDGSLIVWNQPRSR
jgi:hypothetical protein